MANADADLIASVSCYSKSGLLRLQAMADAVRRIDADCIAGDMVECGVWRGGNIILARKLSPYRACWLFDTFTGMTEPEQIDVTRAGKRAIDSYLGKKKPGGKWSAVTVDEVRANLRECGALDDDRLRFVAGPVETTLQDAANVPERIALLRLDTDWHASTKIELEVLYPRLAPGGILIIDDYGHWVGARKAVDEYFGESGPAMHKIDYTAIMMVKPC